MHPAHGPFAAPAKVNFGLRILGKRPDGYHAIETVLQMLDLYDWLTVHANQAGTIQLTCTPAVLPTDDANLIVRAAKLLQHVCGVRQGADITLDKRIPIAAGLGGGSSDAAAALLALDRVWRLRCPRSTLHDLAAQLGSDVPFFLHGPTALACGRGEVLSPLSPPPPLTGVLVNPGFGVSAGWAYGQFRGSSLATDQTTPSILRALASGNLEALADVMVNDLEPGVAAAYPIIRQAQGTLSATGAVVTFMSGSGPTVGGLFPTGVDLQTALPALRRHPSWRVIPFATLSESLHPELRG
jgi:4-diphosphocytidyl-2-C-methyl-D-erythritol kinase